MTIPPKCEDLYLKIAELERRETALLEELKTSRTAFKEEIEGVKYTRRKFRQERDALQQSLTVAEQRAGELEAALINVRETLAREYWDQYAGLDETRDILDAALKPAEGEGS